MFLRSVLVATAVAALAAPALADPNAGSHMSGTMSGMSGSMGGRMSGTMSGMPMGKMSATATGTDDEQAVVKTANAFNDAFDKGDAKAAVALCANPATVIDDFPPHLWTGATACADWGNTLVASDKKLGISNENVTIDKTLHVSVTGDRGYAVFATHYSYKLHGKPVTEGGVWTFVEQKSPTGWRILAWAWAQH